MSQIPNTKNAVRTFVETWTGRGYEKGDSQTFWYQLLHDVFGIDIPANFISFEVPVKLKFTSFIDAYIPSTKVLIEQKSLKKDLQKGIKQSDEQELTPYEQALRYSARLKYSERPRWIVTCNFSTFLIYDMEKPEGEPFEIKLENLEREYHLLRFLVEDVETTLRHEKEISIKAGELIGKLYDELHKQYVNPNAPEVLRSLNILCVRLVFCLFAEDSKLFGNNHAAFHDYMIAFKPSHMRRALIDLFRMLNTPYEQRGPYEEDALLAFPFVNGGLFADTNIEIPQFTPEIVRLLLEECSLGFDWSGISPTIFGALFEDTMNPETREAGGIHYTSVENIHRVIDPLFLNDLKKELKGILQLKVTKSRRLALQKYQEKLSSLTFLDPACGSGNFLTETYLSLRRIENEVIEALYGNQRWLGGELSPILVAIDQFYGMEINDFAVTVARAALWIAEAQMMRETEHIVGKDLEYFPLKSYSHIEQANALLKNWEDVIPSSLLSFIIGNPPFKGKKSRDEEQKQVLLAAIGEDSARPGNLDIVAGWFFNAARFMQGTDIKAAFVATINITRGEQVSLLWDALLNKYGININFAYMPFVWNSESKKKAQVHCTIIGFSTIVAEQKVLYAEEDVPKLADNISPYLRDEENILVTSKNKPICKDIPETGIGNKPIDGGNFLFKPAEKDAFVASEPMAANYFMEWYGADELIKGRHRYFLWLAKCTPAELRRMPLCKERIDLVKKTRSSSSDAGTRKLAKFPTKFHVTNIPDEDFIVIPEVSSENRDYIPMEYVFKKDTGRKLFSNLVKLMPGATLYHFGVLQSMVHMVWTKGVCGYKDFRPRYSTDVVFNNFPWPTPTEKQKENISKTATAIIAARHNHPESSLADLYDVDCMPDDLREAHQQNDAAVRAAYAFPSEMSEEDMIKSLMQMYKQIVTKN